MNLLHPPLPIRRILAPGFRGFEEALRLLDGVIRRLVSERLKAGVDTGDLLSMLLASRDEEAGDAMSENQVRDEVMTMFMAGHETVAIALTWTCYLLSRYPATRRELQAELATALSGRGPTLADLPNLPLTRMVLEESMRLYPPAWGIDRRAEHSDVVGGYEIPAGAAIAISPYVVHHLPAYWNNPEGFDPSRFAPANFRRAAAVRLLPVRRRTPALHRDAIRDGADAVGAGGSSPAVRVGSATRSTDFAETDPQLLTEPRCDDAPPLASRAPVARRRMRSCAAIHRARCVTIHATASVPRSPSVMRM